jgi:hypothetical protein
MTKIKRLPKTLRLASPTAKQVFLDTSEDSLKKIVNMIGASDESPEVKEELANFMVFLLNVLDIEHERLRFEQIKEEAPKRARRKLL